MGQVIKARCGLCQFETSFFYGAGKMNHGTTCNVPAINLATRQFEQVNFIDPNLDRDLYFFYHDPILKGNNLDYNTFDWRNMKLNRVNNFCPNCHKFNFDFKGNTLFCD